MRRRFITLIANQGPSDTTAPTVTITCTQTGPTATSPLNFTFTLSEVSTDFALADITVGNGTAGNFAGSGTSYTCDVTPTAGGAVTVDVAADAFHDAAGNGNTAATQFTIFHVGTVHTWYRADTNTFSDAAGTTPATADDTTVLCLKDNSGNNYSATRASGGLVLKTNIQNSLPVLRGDGVAGKLLKSSTSAFAALGSRTIYLVGKWTSGNFKWLFDGNDSQTSAVYTGTNIWAIAAPTEQTGGTPAAAFKVLTVQFNTGGNDIMRVNGAEIINAAAGNGTTTGWTIGARGDEAGPWIGDFCEAVVHSGLDSAGVIAAMEAGLASRWGITF
jgi:hypothetical protein